MVGNDVVDLDDPETAPEGLNPRFDQRVFSSGERRRLEAAGDAHVLRWTLWAAKESAYKLAKRHDSTTQFTHSLFEVDLADEGLGMVRRGEWLCAVTVSRRGSAVHAVATLPDTDRTRVISGLGPVQKDDDPSVRVRELASTAVARSLERERAAVMITSGKDRVPVLTVDGQSVGFVSLSHHGGHAAFAWIPAP